MLCCGWVLYSWAPQLIKVPIYNCIETLPHCTLGTGGDGRADLVSCFVLASTIRGWALSFLCLQHPTHHTEMNLIELSTDRILRNFTIPGERSYWDLGPSLCWKHQLLNCKSANRHFQRGERPCKILYYWRVKGYSKQQQLHQCTALRRQARVGSSAV